MGPFVPDLISDQLNLVVALVFGIAFGFVLEQAGFSSSRRLVGVFYGYDFTVLRVFFTAAVTAMAGVLLLGSAGLLDTDAIFVNPMWLWPAVVGGIIMGIGFVIGGYCPGTSVCAAAIGKVDAMFFVAGGLLGVFGFAEAYPLVKTFNDSSALGPVKVFASLGIAQGTFAFLLVAAAVAAFAATTWIERRVAPASAPSLRFSRRSHVLAGALLLVLGSVLLVLPDYRSRLLARASQGAAAGALSVPVMTADELAFRIVDHEPNVRIVDVRSPQAFAVRSLPGSVNVATRDLFNKEWSATLSPRHVRKVVVGDTDEQARTAGLLIRDLGYENVAVLEGGFPAFEKTILTAAPFVPAGGRWDADVYKFREDARAEIARIAERAKQAGQKQPKKEKKIQGGC
ncbi:MAG: rhodanese-like domain-containing protein [Acidobacteriota bacterium]